MAVEINIIENGPILVKGETTVTKGGEKVTVVESESVFEANKRLSHYLSEDTRDSEVISVIKAPYEDILHPELTPNYYKQ